MAPHVVKRRLVASVVNVLLRLEEVLDTVDKLADVVFGQHYCLFQHLPYYLTGGGLIVGADESTELLEGFAYLK